MSSCPLEGRSRHHTDSSFAFVHRIKTASIFDASTCQERITGSFECGGGGGDDVQVWTY